MANLEQSKATREASNFNEYTKAEKEIIANADKAADAAKVTRKPITDAAKVTRKPITDSARLLEAPKATQTKSQRWLDAEKKLEKAAQGTSGSGGVDFISSKNGVVEAVGNGQHVVSKHVGKTDAELLQRISTNARIAAASTFTDETVANTVINSTLTDSNNVTKINVWLTNGAQGNLPIPYTGNTVIGRGVRQGSNTVNNLTNAKVILKGNGNAGYDILTAYPSK